MSHGEAGQRKELLVLDGEWRELPGERIPLDVGPRHFEVDGASAPAPSNIRAGDRFFARARVGLRPEQRAAQYIDRRNFLIMQPAYPVHINLI